MYELLLVFLAIIILLGLVAVISITVAWVCINEDWIVNKLKIKPKNTDTKE